MNKNVLFSMVGSNTDLHSILITAIAMGLVISITSCSSQIHLTFAQQVPHLKVAFVTDGKFSDEGWGATGYNATQKLKNKYGFQLATADGVAIPDIESTLRDYADSGYNL